MVCSTGTVFDFSFWLGDLKAVAQPEWGQRGHAPPKQTC